MRPCGRPTTRKRPCAPDGAVRRGGVRAAFPDGGPAAPFPESDLFLCLRQPHQRRMEPDSPRRPMLKRLYCWFAHQLRYLVIHRGESLKFRCKTCGLDWNGP